MDPIFGQSLAERALHAEHAGAHGIAFETNALDLSPGAVLSIAGHPHPQIERKPLLVTSFALDAEHDKAWRAQGKAVFADRPYAPPRVTPRPVVHGLESAVVTGPAGRDIFTDENGRVRVRFPWDRGRTSDAQSSCWIRVSQGWAGAGYGLWTVPRVGQEVLVGFVGGNPDEPIIVGRAPNALNPPPYPLPANESKTVWRSRITPGGEGYNEISFEDLRGQERIYERAERDKESLIRGDERRVVGHDRSRLVKGEENIAIGGSRREQLGGCLHQTIHAEHRVQIGSGVSAIVGGDQQEQIGGRWAVEAEGVIHLVSGQAIIDMEEVPGASGCGVHLRRSEYEALPPERRWAPVLTEATLEQLGALFPRVVWLTMHDNKYWWRFEAALHGKVVRFLFSDMVWGNGSAEGDDELLIASQTPAPEQLALLEELFGVPRAELLPYLSMDGVNMDGLEGFAKVTGIPLLTIVRIADVLNIDPPDLVGA